MLLALQLSDIERELVIQILKQHLPHAKFWLFGSRITNSAKPYSDLDIAIIQDKPIDLVKLGDLEEDFANSSLPFKVDLIDWQRISPEFRIHIESNYIPL